jgi:surface carbohydrate biosynthesis protein (TIGR04326 family)
MLWRSLGDDASTDSVSIPQLIEADAGNLRARYLAWVHEFGERQVQGRRLVDHLEVRPGFSFWWMTLLAEKCNFSKSPQITDAVRLMAFENWATGRAIEKVVLVSAKRPLAECIRLWCLESRISFEWRRHTERSEPLPLGRRLRQCLPNVLQALIWLPRRLIQARPLRGVGLSQWKETKGDVTFFSYLFNLVPNAAAAGRFESRYWAHLPDELQRKGYPGNWFHLHVKDALLPDEAAAADAIRQFNKTALGAQIHVTLEAFVSARVVFRTLLDAGRLAWKGRCLLRPLSMPKAAGLHLWPLFEDDWRRSTFGLTAMSNALYLNLFEAALKMLPRQRVGVYLQENQGWEFALVHAWKASGHGLLVGAPHSTVRYWDLRYFFDPRSYRRGGVNDLPLPDRAALNGKAVLDAYLQGGYPLASVAEVEALRYLHLKSAAAGLNTTARPASSSLRILVLGDYLMSNTLKQMRMLEAAMPLLPKGTIVTVKPHPACPLQSADYPGIRMEVTMAPVWELLTGCDVAYTSNATSAAADAHYAGVPIVSMLDADALNQSPLRGHEGVLFVSSPAGLAHALLASQAMPSSTAAGEDFFTIDLKLPRWQKLLLENGDQPTRDPGREPASI